MAGAPRSGPDLVLGLLRTRAALRATSTWSRTSRSCPLAPSSAAQPLRGSQEGAWVWNAPERAVTGPDDELREFLRGRPARYKIPRCFDVVDVLPKTGSGKIQRSRLRDRALP